MTLWSAGSRKTFAKSKADFPSVTSSSSILTDFRQDAPELQLSATLDEYRRLREQRLSGESKRKQAAAGLLITGLQQRLAVLD